MSKRTEAGIDVSKDVLDVAIKRMAATRVGRPISGSYVNLAVSASYRLLPIDLPIDERHGQS